VRRVVVIVRQVRLRRVLFLAFLAGQAADEVVVIREQSCRPGKEPLRRDPLEGEGALNVIVSVNPFSPTG
jgi:hypothetical protein